MSLARFFTTRLLALCAQSGAAGLSADEGMKAIPVLAPRTAKTTLSRAAVQGKLFPAGHRRQRRYFSTVEFARAWDAEHSAAAIALRAAEARKAAKAAARPVPLPKPVKSRVPHPNDWTDQHKQFLRDNYPTRGARWTSEKLGRPRSGVRAMARKLGIKCLVCVQPAPFKAKPGALLVAAKPTKINPDLRRPPQGRGPAFLPGDPIETAATRRIVCPRMPDPQFSNTYSTV